MRLNHWEASIKFGRNYFIPMLVGPWCRWR